MRSLDPGYFGSFDFNPRSIFHSRSQYRCVGKGVNQPFFSKSAAEALAFLLSRSPRGPYWDVHRFDGVFGPAKKPSNHSFDRRGLDVDLWDLRSRCRSLWNFRFGRPFFLRPLRNDPCKGAFVIRHCFDPRLVSVFVQRVSAVQALQ